MFISMLEGQALYQPYTTYLSFEHAIRIKKPKHYFKYCIPFSNPILLNETRL